MALRSSRYPLRVERRRPRVLDYMHALQRSDHGYALTPTGASDSQSTSWVVQARRKCNLPNTRRAVLPVRPAAAERRVQLPAGPHA